MSWDAKGGGKKYYYKSVRLPGQAHPKKVYLGSGPEAERAARDVEARRQDREARRAALLEEEIRYAGADSALQELGAIVAALVSAALHEEGCYKHKGEWRRGTCRQGR